MQDDLNINHKESIFSAQNKKYLYKNKSINQIKCKNDIYQKNQSLIYKNQENKSELSKNQKYTFLQKRQLLSKRKNLRIMTQNPQQINNQVSHNVKNNDINNNINHNINHNNNHNNSHNNNNNKNHNNNSSLEIQKLKKNSLNFNSVSMTPKSYNQQYNGVFTLNSIKKKIQKYLTQQKSKLNDMRNINNPSQQLYNKNQQNQQYERLLSPQLHKLSRKMIALGSLNYFNKKKKNCHYSKQMIKRRLNFSVVTHNANDKNKIMKEKHKQKVQKFLNNSNEQNNKDKPLFNINFNGEMLNMIQQNDFNGQKALQKVQKQLIFQPKRYKFPLKTSSNHQNMNKKMFNQLNDELTSNNNKDQLNENNKKQSKKPALIHHLGDKYFQINPQFLSMQYPQYNNQFPYSQQQSQSQSQSLTQQQMQKSLLQIDTYKHLFQTQNIKSYKDRIIDLKDKLKILQKSKTDPVDPLVYYKESFDDQKATLGLNLRMSPNLLDTQMFLKDHFVAIKKLRKFFKSNGMNKQSSVKQTIISPPLQLQINIQNPQQKLIFISKKSKNSTQKGFASVINQIQKTNKKQPKSLNQVLRLQKKSNSKYEFSLPKGNDNNYGYSLNVSPSKNNRKVNQHIRNSQDWREFEPWKNQQKIDQTDLMISNNHILLPLINVKLQE